ncbi:MAG: hypothetical protein HRU14_11935 [Planctomycetes bacterium]|jgi:hypothetical protein|nr:hypothetical protein [Planctomycetota bacterium]
MRRLRLGRYLVGWVLALGLGLLVGELLGAQADDVGRFRASVASALLVVGIADLAVYVTVARGLIIDPEKFIVSWGLSVLGKFTWIGVMGLVVITTGAVAREVFLLAMAATFPVLTAHQVVRLVKLADAERTKKAP